MNRFAGYASLLFLIGVAGWPPVWERADYSVYCAYVAWAFVSVLLSLFCFGGGMWDLIVLVPNYCLSFDFDNANATTAV